MGDFDKTRKKATGIGGPCQYVPDPNKPSFDPATLMGRDNRITELLQSSELTAWERDFLASIYGIRRMSKKQCAALIRITQRIRRLEKP